MTTSVPKQIEDVIVADLPRRYAPNGHRNWTLLNKDAAILQKNLHGKFPSRQNLLQLLHSVILDSSIPLTDHCISSQKRLLSNEYGIVLPTDYDGGTVSFSGQLQSLQRQNPQINRVAR